MRPKRTSLRVEGLETRDTPAVTASVVAGDLFVTGDAANDTVYLSRLANGATRIQGMNGTTINGPATFVDLAFNDDLIVNLGAGFNNLQVLNVNGGITADDVDIKTGSSGDFVYIYRLNVLDDIFVDTGAGSDYVALHNVTASNRDNPANGAGDDGINIYTRGGNDNVSSSNSYSAEDIVIILDESLTGAPGFNDQLSMDNVRALDDFFLYGFGGGDKMYLNNLTAGDVLQVTLGAGNDFLKLTNSRATTFSTHADTGTDTLQYYNDTYSTWNYTGFETYRNAP